MDKLVNKPIVDFITDFNLLHPDGLMCFDALVYYVTDKGIRKFRSEVTIATIRAKELDAIYVLNAEIQKDGLKEMFEIKQGNIEYIKDKWLLINGISPSDPHRVAIHPLNNDCDEVAITEKFIDYLKTH